MNPAHFLLSLSACGTVQTAQYAALEKVGVHKRDILIDRIEKTAKTQEQTKEQFKSAYETLAGLVEVDDQGLEKQYKRMARAVENSEEKAEELQARIESVDKVAARVDPVLKVLQDNTLYLKHNLNARAINGISNEVLLVETKVAQLIEQMEASIGESKLFIKSMQGQ